MTAYGKLVGVRTLYSQVRTELLRRLEDRTWGPGMMLPSEMELAREFGVSQGTVRKAPLAREPVAVRPDVYDQDPRHQFHGGKWVRELRCNDQPITSRKLAGPRRQTVSSAIEYLESKLSDYIKPASTY